MAFKSKIQRTFSAPADRVWAWLTQPDLVKKYFFGTQLVTTWQVGEPIFFRGEWDGKGYEDRGLVLVFEPEKAFVYSYLSSWSGLADAPENYQIIAFRLLKKGKKTVVSVEQRRIPALAQKVDSAKNWGAVLDGLQKMLAAEV